MKFEDIPDRDKLKVNVFLVDIENVGAWVLKFRKTGVIINNRYGIPSVHSNAIVESSVMSNCNWPSHLVLSAGILS
jgi:hypothetical protein